MHPPSADPIESLPGPANAQMDSLEALLGVCAKIGTPGEAQLHAHRAGQYTKLVNGRSLASAGCKPILHMRNFQATKALPEALVKDILSRVQQSSH